jgi:hypothetical protein
MLHRSSGRNKGENGLYIGYVGQARKIKYKRKSQLKYTITLARNL